MNVRGPRWVWRLAALLTPTMAAVAVVIIGACGGGGNSPSAGTTPSPSATPPTAASPTPVPVVSNCARIGLGTGSGHGCPRESASFQTEVEAAIDRLIREKPHIFNMDEPGGPGSFRIVSVGQYYVGLIQYLDQVGLCADFDGEELQVKNSNQFNDQYDVQTASNFVLRGPAAYRSTCYPAAFPTPSPPMPAVPGCSQAPSREKACGRERETFLSAVETAIDQVMREHPEYFNPGDTQPGTGYIRITNPDAYFRDLAAAITRQGLCAWYDGEEMAVKRDNVYSEQYDLYGGAGYARRGPGSYQVTCYPAAF